MLLVKNFNHSNNMNGVDTASSRIGKDGDEDMFFDIEGSRVQGELPAGAFEKGMGCDFGSHELPQRHHSNLGRDGGDRKRLCSVPEELVEEGEEDAGEGTQNPHSKC